MAADLKRLDRIDDRMWSEVSQGLFGHMLNRSIGVHNDTFSRNLKCNLVINELGQDAAVDGLNGMSGGTRPLLAVNGIHSTD